MALKVTEAAIKEVKNIMKEQELDKSLAYLRLGVKGGGCSGFSYTLDLTETFNEDSDEMVEIGDIRVICDPKSHIYLNGTELDFQDEIMGRGFVFNNPNATSSCGCGSSFSA